MTAVPAVLVLLVGGVLALAALAVLVYALVRLSGWSPGDGAPATSARMHGFAMALIGLLAVLFACLLLTGLVEDGFSDHRVTDAQLGPGASATEFPTTPPDPFSATLTAALPAMLLLGIHAVAQRTWPRRTGPVRTARLVARRSPDYVPRPLLWCVLGIGAIALAAAALSWTTPEVPALHLYYEAETSTLGTYTIGTRPGSDVAPWLALALLLLAAATAATTVLVARRPPLTGLSPAVDDAIRRVAVHRLLRTAAAGALAVLLVAVTAWSSGVTRHAERTAAGGEDGLDGLAEDYAASIVRTPNGIDLRDPTGLADPAQTVEVPFALDLVAAGAPIAVLIGMAVLLLWRPAAAREIRATSP